MNQCLYSTLRSLVASSGAPRSRKFQEAALWFLKGLLSLRDLNFSPHYKKKKKYGRR